MSWVFLAASIRRLHFPGRFTCFTTRQVAILHCGDFNMDIDSIHQRTGDLGSITLNLRNGAGAFIVGVTIITARAWVHGSDQHKAGRVGEGGGCPRDCHPLLFQGLAHDLQNILLEFGQFIQKKNPIMRETNLSGFWDTVLLQ